MPGKGHGSSSKRERERTALIERLACVRPRHWGFQLVTSSLVVFPSVRSLASSPTLRRRGQLGGDDALSSWNTGRSESSTFIADPMNSRDRTPEFFAVVSSLQARQVTRRSSGQIFQYLVVFSLQSSTKPVLSRKQRHSEFSHIAK